MVKLVRLKNMNWIVFTKHNHELSWEKDFFVIWNNNFNVVTAVSEHKVIPFLRTNKWIKVD
ncbi:MAG: hypothetical protein ACTSVB_04075 [Candidatus Heimdallarchaeaceae archaeon]